MLHNEELTGAAIEVHRAWGPGLLESAYEHCLCRELELRELGFQRQVAIPLSYKGEALDIGYRIDILVEGLVVLELKTVAELSESHKAQLLTYLKLSNLSTGLLLNFNSPTLKDGIVRMVL